MTDRLAHELAALARRLRLAACEDHARGRPDLAQIREQTARDLATILDPEPRPTGGAPACQEHP